MRLDAHLPQSIPIKTLWLELFDIRNARVPGSINLLDGLLTFRSLGNRDREFPLSLSISASISASIVLSDQISDPWRSRKLTKRTLVPIN